MSLRSTCPSPLASSSAKPELIFCVRKSDSTIVAPLASLAVWTGSLYVGMIGLGSGSPEAFVLWRRRPLDCVVAHLALDHPGSGKQTRRLGSSLRQISATTSARATASVGVAAPSPARTLRRAACNVAVKEIRSGSTLPSP